MYIDNNDNEIIDVTGTPLTPGYFEKIEKVGGKTSFFAKLEGLKSK
ncbi:MAG: hypothetical protein IJN48_02745 [Clostridia bacterium]|nr:hypothetical protein [Clostridia bacterium]